MAIPARKPTKRRMNARSLVYALDGPEQKYPVYPFSRGKRKFERPKHNPFKDL